MTREREAIEQMESSGELDGISDLLEAAGHHDAATALRGRKVHRKRGQKPGTTANIRQRAEYYDFYMRLPRRDAEGNRVSADTLKQQTADKFKTNFRLMAHYIESDDARVREYWRKHLKNNDSRIFEDSGVFDRAAE